MPGAVEGSRSVAVRVRMRNTEISVIWRRIRRWKNSYSGRRIIRFKNYLNELYAEEYSYEINKQERYCRFHTLTIIRRRICNFSGVNRVTGELRFVKNGPFRAYSEEVNRKRRNETQCTNNTTESRRMPNMSRAVFVTFRCVCTLSQTSLTLNMQTYALFNRLENHNF